MTNHTNDNSQQAAGCQQNIQAALEFLEVFPNARFFPCVWEGTHKPRIRWKSETPESQPKAAWYNALQQWAAKYGPNTYYCVALSESGLCVVDVDTKHGKNGATTLAALEAYYGELPTTTIARTPSGGRHYFFKGGVPVTKANALGPGVDLPGMVPVPGSSVHGKGDYVLISNAAIAPLPAWIREAVPQRKEPSTTDTNTAKAKTDHELDILRAIRFLEDREGAIEGRGGDDYTYQTAAKLRDMGLSEPVAFALLFAHWNPKCQPAWGFAELREKVRNAFRYATGRPGSESVLSAFSPKPDKPELLEKSVLKASDLVQMPATNRRVLLHPWLTTKSIGMVYAPRGVGKSWFALGVAKAIASGSAFGPWEAPLGQQARVLYWDGELPMEDLIERAKQLGLDVLDNLYLLSSDVFRSVADQHGVNTTTPRLSQEWYQHIYRTIKQLDIDLVIMDNLSSLLTTGDENDRQSWTEVNSFLLELRWLGVASMFVHHAGKSGNQRGTSSREDALDYVIKLEQPEDYEEEDGARFSIAFTKKRVPHHLLSLLVPTIAQWDGQQWTFTTGAAGRELAVLEYIAANPRQTARSIAARCMSDLPLRTARRQIAKILEALLAKGMVKKIEDGAYTKYEATLDED